MTALEDIRRNFDDIRRQLTTMGRADVEVIGVTKKFDADIVRLAAEAGITNIGENYAQEAVAKRNQLNGLELRWHFIGQLQRNKVKVLAPFIAVWHSVDSIALSDEIARRAPAAQIFIEVNLTDDPDRGGCDWGEVKGIVDSSRRNGLEVLGLMGVAPQANEIKVRAGFRRLADTAATLDLSGLSMGMSSDWQLAVEEGATAIRLGTTLFGQRPRPGADQGRLVGKERPQDGVPEPSEKRDVGN